MNPNNQINFTNLPTNSYVFNNEYNTSHDTTLKNEEYINYHYNRSNLCSVFDKPWTRATKDPSMIQKGTEMFVGNLCSDTNENDLFDAFRDYGEIIDIRIHKNAQTRKCYAFIRFLDKEMLKNGLNQTNIIVKGRNVKVTKSNENSTIFIGNIRKNWTNQDVETKVKRIFPNCDKIEHFADSNLPNKNRGFCFVVFKARNDAIKALNYVASKGGINIDGVPLTCDWADVVDEDDSNSKQIFISGLDENVDEIKLRHVFSSFGKIVDASLSKSHKNSKRKDLAFVTYSSHSEAKNAVENYKNLEDAQILGDSVTISLAFSQQAMQAKKKVKESRKKPTIVAPTQVMNNAPSYVHSSTNMNTNTISQIGMNSAQNLNSLNTHTLNAQLANLNPMPSFNIPSQNPLSMSALNPNLNSTAMLAMMNIINMNKNNVNISPELMTKMMTACFESILSQQNTQQTLQQVNPMNNLNTINSLNPLNVSLNTLNSLNSFNAHNNLSGNKLGNKRFKKISKKKRVNVLNNSNNQSI